MNSGNPDEVVDINDEHHNAEEKQTDQRKNSLRINSNLLYIDQWSSTPGERSLQYHREGRE